MLTFSDLTKQVHLINDMILSDMICDADDSAEESSSFSRHLLATKNWFSRISWANKKRYVLALLEDVRSAWALSLLLKSLWNCRPKDAVLSANEKAPWSSYDVVSLDHNRTALPLTTLAQVMKSDRVWFLTLEPEVQAMVLAELLTVAGGPVMWAVMRRAQVLYERYRDNQMHNLQECIVVNEQLEASPRPTSRQTMGSGKKESPGRKSSAVNNSEPTKQGVSPGRAQKELETNLAAWNATIKSLKDNLKLEEQEMTFNDGSKRKIWKVNRPKPEAIETVDFVQLLPSAVGKLILSYLPRAQLGDYARVNKYWAFLVDEFRAELTARQKIKLDMDKLNENMLRHDTSLELVEQIDVQYDAPFSSLGNASAALSLKARTATSIRPSEKSGGAYSMRHFLNENLNKQQTAKVQIPIRNMAELSKRLEQRGAADENLWGWCENILKHVKVKKDGKTENQEGVLTLGNVHFPCPLMKKCLEVPLDPPLFKDPAAIPPLKPRKNISNAVLHAPKEQGAKRYSLWTRDFSGLYPVYKIPSYQSPF